ncbi:MAG: hypothetical protein CM1200mP18_16530 [Gammaproteobacteria bacterium]|nr:MAG: hypothetical protein CM1200mP18_16530 [Gammaproteobacteria bacterium]
MVKNNLIVLILLLLLGSAIGKADQKDSATAMRSVIQTQLDAFARNDAVKAYAQASPRIQSTFPIPKFSCDGTSGLFGFNLTCIRCFLGVVDDSNRPVFGSWLRGERGVGGWRFTLWCNWPMPAGESAVFSYQAVGRVSLRRNRLQSFSGLPQDLHVAVWVCRQVKDDRAAHTWQSSI